MSFNTGMTKIILPLLAVLALSVPVSAQENAAVQVTGQQSLAGVLGLAQSGKLTVVLHVKNGVAYTGKIKDVGSNAVVMAGPAGKEFYDVYVPLTEISSVELKVRSK